MPTDKKLNNLIINYLTEEQYKSATKNEDELYLTPDVGGNEIETIDGTWDGDDFTLSKTPTSFPFMARLTMAGTNNIAEVYFSDAFSSSEENIKIGLYNDAQSMYVFLYYPEDTSKNAVIQHPYIQGTNIADKVLVSKADKSAKWQFLKTINSQSLLGEGNIDIGGSDIEVINCTFNEDGNTFTLEKEVTTLPAVLAFGNGGLLYFLTVKIDLGSDFGGTGYFASLANDGQVSTITVSGLNGKIEKVIDISTLQDKLVSGTNIKTINGNSILGSGDLTIKASNEATALTNENLNDLTTDGASYYASGSNAVTNKPTGIDAFGLVIRRTASGYYAQYLTGANQSANSIYVRTYKSGTWTAWTKLLDNQSESTLLDKFAEYAQLASDNTFSGNNVFKNGTVSVEDTTSTADTTTYHGNHIHRIRRNKADKTTSSWDFQLPSANGTLATKEDIESVYAKKTDLNAYATNATLAQKIPDPPSANGTYIYKAIRSDSGVTFEWVLES